jgi:membrane protease YdiL (CAAX protease family)
VVKISTSARSPLLPTLWPADAFVWWQSLLFALAVIATSLAGAILFGMLWAFVFGRHTLTAPSTVFLLTDQCAAYLVALPLLLVTLPRLARRSLRELGLRAPTNAEIGWGLAGTLGMYAVSEIIGTFEEHALHLKVQETAVELLKTVHGPTILAFAVLACIVAPFVEELTFRGFVFNALLRYMNPAVAAVLASLLFGLAHGSWTALAPLAGAGLVLAAVYYRTGALSASMIAHAGFNALGVAGYVFFKAT